MSLQSIVGVVIQVIPGDSETLKGIQVQGNQVPGDSGTWEFRYKGIQIPEDLGAKGFWSKGIQVQGDSDLSLYIGIKNMQIKRCVNIPEN